MRRTTLLILLLIPIIAAAQGLSDMNGQSYVRKSGSSLFDPSKLSISGSYSLGYYSGGGHSGSIGYYMNSLEYRFSNPLKIRVDVGYLHNPSAMFSGNSAGQNKGVIVPAVSIDWRPSENFNFRLDYRQVPVDYYRSGYGLNPYLQEDYR